MMRFCLSFYRALLMRAPLPCLVLPSFGTPSLTGLRSRLPSFSSGHSFQLIPHLHLDLLLRYTRLSFRIHLSRLPRSRRTSQAKRAQMAAMNANAATANANKAAVTAATGALTVSMGTDKAVAAGVGAVRRGRTTTKRDREIYTPTPPASPEASTTPQNSSYTSNESAGGMTLHPVPERSGNGDSCGNHAGSYGSVPLSYPDEPGVTTGNEMVSPSSAASTNNGRSMMIAQNPYGVYPGQTKGPVMLFSPTDYPQPSHPNTLSHSHSMRDREGDGSNYPSPLSVTSSSHYSSLNGSNGGGAGGHPGMHRSNSYVSHHSAVNIHSGSHVSVCLFFGFFCLWTFCLNVNNLNGS